MDTLTSAGFSGSVYVEAGDTTLVAAGYGTVAANSDLPVTDSTLFYVASVSKQFTGMAVQLAVHDGLLSLDGRVGDYLSEVPPDKAGISIKELMAHSSGLPEYVFGWRESISMVEARTRILSSELRFTPGREYAYSNAGYTLLAIILEQVTGESFPAYMHRKIFTPLAMTDTYLLGESPPVLEEAHGQLENGESWAPSDWSGPGWAHMGSGGVVSTLRDMRAWARSLATCSSLPREACLQFRQPLIETRNGSYASGIRTQSTADGGSLLYHFGSEANGHNAAVMVYVERPLIIVTLSNRSPERSYASATAVALSEKVLTPQNYDPPFYVESHGSAGRRISSKSAAQRTPDLGANGRRGLL